MIRRPASLHRVPAGRVPRLLRYYQGATTPCRPSRRTSFPSLGGTSLARSFRSRRHNVRCRGPGGLLRAPVAPAGFRLEATGPPTFLGNPDCALALLFDPGRPCASGPRDAPARPPRCPRRRRPRRVFRGSITRLRHSLSTLRSPGRPRTTQDSLPAVGQTLPDGLAYPKGSDERLQCVIYMARSSSFPKLSQRKDSYYFLDISRLLAVGCGRIRGHH